MVNGWTDGAKVEPECGNSAVAPYYNYTILISSCYPILE